MSLSLFLDWVLIVAVICWIECFVTGVRGAWPGKHTVRL